MTRLVGLFLLCLACSGEQFVAATDEEVTGDAGALSTGGTGGSGNAGSVVTGGAEPTGGVAGVEMGGSGGTGPPGGMPATGGVPTGGAQSTGGGSAPTRCDDFPNTRPVWSQRSTVDLNLGTGPVPETIEHTLRVWYSTPNEGFCDELYGGQFGGDAARIFLMNGQTGNFWFPLDNMCNYSFTPPADAAIVSPGESRFPAPRFPDIIAGACLHVERNSITASGETLTGFFDVTWELVQ
jgi:hypothetical protein